MKKDARGQRGKDTEKEVEELFTEWNSQTFTFAWHRMPDARAAMGRLKAQPCDYLVFRGEGMLLEVKETTHDYRLAKDKVAQRAVLEKFRLAGARTYVLVHHTGLGQWRIVSTANLEGGIPSWDLRDYTLYDTAADALRELEMFKGLKS